MSDEPFTKPLLRRLGVDHWTEHDFEMERIGSEQSRQTYEKRLKQLEAAGWEPFKGPFYYARREFHGGYYVPGTRDRVPTEVAFAMFREQNPDIALKPYKPHPHGWKRPVNTEGLIHQELVKVEPMPVPTRATEGTGATSTIESHVRPFARCSEVWLESWTWGGGICFREGRKRRTPSQDPHLLGRAPSQNRSQTRS